MLLCCLLHKVFPCHTESSLKGLKPPPNMSLQKLCGVDLVGGQGNEQISHYMLTWPQNARNHFQVPHFLNVF